MGFYRKFKGALENLKMCPKWWNVARWILRGLTSSNIEVVMSLRGCQEIKETFWHFFGGSTKKNNDFFLVPNI